MPRFSPSPGPAPLARVHRAHQRLVRSARPRSRCRTCAPAPTHRSRTARAGSPRCAPASGAAPASCPPCGQPAVGPGGSMAVAAPCPCPQKRSSTHASRVSLVFSIVMRETYSSVLLDERERHPRRPTPEAHRVAIDLEQPALERVARQQPHERLVGLHQRAAAIAHVQPGEPLLKERPPHARRDRRALARLRAAVRRDLRAGAVEEREVHGRRLRAHVLDAHPGVLVAQAQRLRRQRRLLRGEYRHRTTTRSASARRGTRADPERPHATGPPARAPLPVAVAARSYRRIPAGALALTVHASTRRCHCWLAHSHPKRRHEAPSRSTDSRHPSPRPRGLASELRFGLSRGPFLPAPTVGRGGSRGAPAPLSGREGAVTVRRERNECPERSDRAGPTFGATPGHGDGDWGEGSERAGPEGQETRARRGRLDSTHRRCYPLASRRSPVPGCSSAW